MMVYNIQEQLIKASQLVSLKILVNLLFIVRNYSVTRDLDRKINGCYSDDIRALPDFIGDICIPWHKII